MHVKIVFMSIFCFELFVNILFFITENKNINININKQSAITQKYKKNKFQLVNFAIFSYCQLSNALLHTYLSHLFYID
jgi:hypothetical protein